MRLQVGQVARGEDYFPRDYITNDIWDKLNTGHNLLLAAPRRVGKSSILFNLLDNKPDEFVVVYFQCEAVQTTREFYDKLYNLIIIEFPKYRNKLQQLFHKAAETATRIESFSLKDLSFTLGASESDFVRLFRNLLLDLELGNKRLIILIDEFAQTVENMCQDNREQEARMFLHSKRELRLMPELQRRVQFVYAGSIGLENIVHAMDATKTINDIAPIAVPPLTQPEALELCRRLMAGVCDISDAAINHMLQRLEWLAPYYIQAVLESVQFIVKRDSANFVTMQMIDRAIDRVLSTRSYFATWQERLSSIKDRADKRFAMALLNYIAEHTCIETAEILNLTQQHSTNDSYKNIINILKHDGYIDNSTDAKTYRFISPLLRQWWYQNVAN